MASEPDAPSGDVAPPAAPEPGPDTPSGSAAPPAAPEPAGAAPAPGPAAGTLEAPAPDPAGAVNPVASKKRRAKAFWGRFAIGHFAAYPVCFLTAAGAIPLAMIVRRERLMSPEQGGASSSIMQDVARDLKLSAIEAAQVEIVLSFVMWVCIAVFVLIHFAVLPWSFGAAAAVSDPERGTPASKRGLRIFGVTMATTIAAVAVGGTAGWIWILTQ